MAKRRKGKRPRISRETPTNESSFLKRYPNLLLGLTIAVIVFVLGMLVFNTQQLNSFPKNFGLDTITGGQTPTPSEIKQETSTRTYTVKQGDSLWTIAENAYGSGFNAYDIAKVNKLANPSAIEPGQRLTLPSVQTKEPTRGEVTSESASTTPPSELHQNAIRSSTYTIVRGDCLWTIAERKYGDGMMWSVIARANNLANPNLIFSGNTLTLP